MCYYWHISLSMDKYMDYKIDSYSNDAAIFMGFSCVLFCFDPDPSPWTGSDSETKSKCLFLIQVWILLIILLLLLLLPFCLSLQSRKASEPDKDKKGLESRADSIGSGRAIPIKQVRQSLPVCPKYAPSHQSDETSPYRLLFVTDALSRNDQTQETSPLLMFEVDPLDDTVWTPCGL